MKKFSDYASEQKNNQGAEKGKKGGESTNFNNQNAFDLLKKVASKYEGASENELILAIMQEAKRAKESGQLSNEDIQNFVLTISPMLSISQRQKLDKIVNEIINQN